MKKIIEIILTSLGFFGGLEPTGFHASVDESKKQVIVTINFAGITTLEKDVLDAILSKIDALENVIDVSFDNAKDLVITISY